MHKTSLDIIQAGFLFKIHSGNFNVDENALKVGAELYAQYALAYLGQNEF